MALMDIDSPELPAFDLPRNVLKSFQPEREYPLPSKKYFKKVL